MLKEIIIHNFGLIDELKLEFNSNLTIFTGETGAGKSIILGALRFVLGERFTSSLMRDKSKKCSVQAIFEPSKETFKEIPELSQHISDNETELIISRTITPDQKNKISINGLRQTVRDLKALGDKLIDFHGPHDHQMLLSKDAHIMILDRLCAFEKIKSEYQREYDLYTSLQSKLKNLNKFAANRERDLDILSFQIKELEQVDLTLEAYNETLNAFKKIQNAQKLYHEASTLLSLFEAEDQGLSDMTAKACSISSKLSATDEEAHKIETAVSELQNANDSIIIDLQNYLDSISFEPGEAEEITEKCDSYNSIIKKYGPEIEDAADFYAKAKDKYETLIDYEHNDSKLKKELENAKNTLLNTAKTISAKRKKTAKELQGIIESELKDLGIKHVKFECRFERKELDFDGIDDITFYISPNAGEDLKPLSEIVSSGEAARLMLALKRALTKVDPIPVLVFDEIDAQIGGRLGTITGRKLKEISGNRQVLLITHLPQIAAFADEHINVSKNVHNNKTFIQVSNITQAQRLEELSRMMGDDFDNNVAIRHAEEMIKKAEACFQ